MNLRKMQHWERKKTEEPENGKNVQKYLSFFVTYIDSWDMIW